MFTLPGPLFLQMSADTLFIPNHSKFAGWRAVCGGVMCLLLLFLNSSIVQAVTNRAHSMYVHMSIDTLCYTVNVGRLGSGQV